VVRCSDGVLTELSVAEFAGLLRVLHGQKAKVLSGERVQRSPRDLLRSATHPPPTPNRPWPPGTLGAPSSVPSPALIGSRSG
jgi:hypothetical protein